MGATTLANKISIARIILVPFFIAAVVYQRHTLALAVFLLAVISDGLDGFIARTFNQKTALGTIIDPIADKLLLVSAFLALTLAPASAGAMRLPPYVPIIVISRDIMLVVGSAIVYVTKGDLRVSPSIVGKVTTFFQMMTIVSVLVHFRYAPVVWNVAVILTMVSGLDYIVKGSRFLSENHLSPKKA